MTSSEFNDFWNDTQGSYMDDLAGRFQLRANGKTGMNTGLIENETILQKLSPFIEPVTLEILDGKANKPNGFIYRLGMRINGYDVHKINYNQIAAVNDNVIDPPSVTDNMYYMVEYKNYYKFYPNTVTECELDCMNAPTDVVWGYTFDADDRQVYNPGTSVQSLWDSNSQREINKRVLTTLGISFKDADFLNFGKTVQAVGE